jgi:methyl coenzyme M reductase beta subunit
MKSYMLAQQMVTTAVAVGAVVTDVATPFLPDRVVQLTTNFVGNDTGVAIVETSPDLVTWTTVLTAPAGLNVAEIVWAGHARVSMTVVGTVGTFDSFVSAGV